MHLCICMYVHIYTYTCVCVCVCVFNSQSISDQWKLVSSQFWQFDPYKFHLDSEDPSVFLGKFLLRWSQAGSEQLISGPLESRQCSLSGQTLEVHPGPNIITSSSHQQRSLALIISPSHMPDICTLCFQTHMSNPLNSLESLPSPIVLEFKKKLSCPFPTGKGTKCPRY